MRKIAEPSTCVRRSVTLHMHHTNMKLSRSLSVAAFALSVSSCESGLSPLPTATSLVASERHPFVAPMPNRSLTGRIMLVALDGVRWQEIFVGSDPSISGSPPRSPGILAPNLHRLATERGAALGAPGRGIISATGPHYVSLPGYNELLAGQPPVWCADNNCPGTKTPTLLDEIHAAGGKVAAFASWEMLERAVSSTPGSFPTSCGRGGDSEITPSPGSGDYRPDRVTSAVALAYYEAEHPDAFFLGLGDTDEHAHHHDYEGYLAALAHADDVVGKLVTLADRASNEGIPTTLIVTADHGRARDFHGHGAYAPESARVWLIAAGSGVRARGAVTSPRARYLADVAPTLRVIAGFSSMVVGTGATGSEALDELLRQE
jgi:hypothetical protein